MDRLNIMDEQPSIPPQRLPQIVSAPPTLQDLSVPSSAPLQGPLIAGIAMPHLGPASGPSSGIGGQLYQRFSSTAGPASGSAGYTQAYYPSSVSQSAPPPGYHDHGHAQGQYITNSNVEPNASSTPQAQKRAYRQRRKDPSCDACRERKVKCDATDSSSCTECRSRSVNCQFTKETNRRMGSMKHNQDLSKDLAQALSQVAHLQSLLSNSERVDSIRGTYAHLPGSDTHLPGHNTLHLPGPEPSYDLLVPKQYQSLDRPSKRRRTISQHDLSKVGSNMTRLGRGIFKPPNLHERELTAVPAPSPSLLPPKHVADMLLDQFYSTLHQTMPILHWGLFRERYEAVYQNESLHKMSHIWSALLFAVFACGTMHRSWSDGARYLEISRSFIDLWTEDFTLDHARTALLSSIFLVEMNLKSAGWTWIGIAVGVAFDIGLQCEAGTWPSTEEEMRRRVWWSIYIWDCLLSLELGRSPIIKEEDCDVAMPNPVDDQQMYKGGNWNSHSPDLLLSPFLPTIQLMGGIAKLSRILKRSRLPTAVLEAYDSHFNICIEALPSQKQVRNNHYIDPVELHPIIYLQNARLILHRHNLRPVCDPVTRSAAIDHCVAVAKDTVRMLRRCMQEPSAESQSDVTRPTDPWDKRMISAATTFFCTHIWRCTLFLIYGLEFECALICIRASSIVGNSRPVNAACGRYSDFFLREVISRGNGRDRLDFDEEMVAYLSADLQGNFENSWVWQEGKGGMDSSKGLPNFADHRQGRTGDGQNGEMIAEEGEAEWSGWDHVRRSLEGLVQEQRRESTVEGQSRPTSGELSSLTAASPTSTNPPNRMSIKDLI